MWRFASSHNCPRLSGAVVDLWYAPRTLAHTMPRASSTSGSSGCCYGAGAGDDGCWRGLVPLPGVRACACASVRACAWCDVCVCVRARARVCVACMSWTHERMQHLCCNACALAVVVCEVLTQLRAVFLRHDSECAHHLVDKPVQRDCHTEGRRFMSTTSHTHNHANGAWHHAHKRTNDFRLRVSRERECRTATRRATRRASKD